MLGVVLEGFQDLSAWYLIKGGTEMVVSQIFQFIAIRYINPRRMRERYSSHSVCLCLLPR